MEKRQNPYERLKKIGRDYSYSVTYRDRKIMFRYPKDKLATGWNLTDLAERTQAAKQLGYCVELKVTDAGLEVWYVKNVPEQPYEFA